MPVKSIQNTHPHLKFSVTISGFFSLDSTPHSVDVQCLSQPLELFDGLGAGPEIYHLLYQ